MCKILYFSLKSFPNRHEWAKDKCSIIKDGPTFQHCRTDMKGSLVDKFYEDCLTDACSCDKGGDCECLCTAVANFAEACATMHNPVHWRSNHFCRKCSQLMSKFSINIMSNFLIPSHHVHWRSHLQIMWSPLSYTHQRQQQHNTTVQRPALLRRLLLSTWHGRVSEVSNQHRLSLVCTRAGTRC